MKKKILIVDDDSEFRKAVRTLLEPKGYQVLSAKNGEMGFMLARRRQPHLILLDIMMAHDLEGCDISRKLNAYDETRDIPVIMVTGYYQTKKVNWKFTPHHPGLPVKTILEKPVDPELFLETIEKALKKRPSPV